MISFGPLVISGVYTDRGIARNFSIQAWSDSKRISSDARIRALAEAIRKSSQGLVETVLIGPARYNELYEKFSNLNRLLGWGHARVIENLLERKPDCARSLSDQFADARVIKESLLRRARHIVIEQRPRAESDVAVAAASIIARGVHQLAGAKGQRARRAIGTRRIAWRERGRRSWWTQRDRKPCAM